MAMRLATFATVPVNSRLFRLMFTYPVYDRCTMNSADRHFWHFMPLCNQELTHSKGCGKERLPSPPPFIYLIINNLRYIHEADSPLRSASKPMKSITWVLFHFVQLTDPEIISR